MAIINNIDEALGYVKNILETAQKRANDTFPKIQKLNDIKNAPIVNVYTANAFTFSNYYSSSQPFTSVEQVDKKLAEYQAMLEANIKTIEEAHAINEPLIENNKLVREKITVVMHQIGILGTYSVSEFKTNRSRTKTTTTHTAGYLQDLNRNCFIDDMYQSKITAAKSAFEALKRKADSEKQRIVQEKREADKIEKDKKSVQALARLQVKYGLDEDSGWLDVQEALDQRDKYFMLARAMEDTRGDWSEGFYRVEYAHGKFVVDTEEDKEIDKEISEILERDHEDGRVFRDCDYNYSVLYSKVSEELLKDYATIQEYYSKY